MTDENLTGLDLTENDLIQLCSSFQNELHRIEPNSCGLLLNSEEK